MNEELFFRNFGGTSPAERSLPNESFYLEINYIYTPEKASFDSQNKTEYNLSMSPIPIPIPYGTQGLSSDDSNSSPKKGNSSQQKMGNEKSISDHSKKENNLYFMGFKEKLDEKKSSNMTNSFQSTIQKENKNGLGNSQPDNTKKLPATSEKNKINSKPEEDPSLIEKK